jgi:hypothetical protein
MCSEAFTYKKMENTKKFTAMNTDGKAIKPQNGQLLKSI